MSSQSEQAAIQAVSDITALTHISIAGSVLLTYDSLLTLSYDIEYIWQKKFKLGTVLYLLTRFATLLYLWIVGIGRVVGIPSIQTCDAIVHFADIINTLSLIGGHGILLARAYSVTDHRRLVLAVLAILGICTLVPDLAGTILDRCSVTAVHSLIILSDLTTIPTILFDTVVVVVTLASTVGTWRIYRRSVWNKLSLIHLLAQQSVMRFGFVLTITLTGVVVPLMLRPSVESALAPMQNSLSAIIIGRFHLDLQRRNAHHNSNTSLPTLSIGTFRAATRSMHDAVMAEFGDSDADVSVITEESGEAVEPEDPGVTKEDDIALQVVEIQFLPQEVIGHKRHGFVSSRHP